MLCARCGCASSRMLSASMSKVNDTAQRAPPGHGTGLLIIGLSCLHPPTRPHRSRTPPPDSPAARPPRQCSGLPKRPKGTAASSSWRPAQRGGEACEFCLQHRSIDRTRAHRIDANALTGEFHRERPAPGEERALRPAISAISRLSDQGQARDATLMIVAWEPAPSSGTKARVTRKAATKLTSSRPIQQPVRRCDE